jgi:hypothetical protein
MTLIFKLRLLSSARQPPFSLRQLMLLRNTRSRETTVMLGTVLLVLLILMLLGAIPNWPHSRNWGYYPSSGIGLILVVLVILVLLGKVNIG